MEDLVSNNTQKREQKWSDPEAEMMAISGKKQDADAYC